MSAREAFRVDILLFVRRRTARVRERERERERERVLRERIKGVVASSFSRLRFLSSLREAKKEHKFISIKEQSGSQKRKSLLSSNATLSSSFFRAHRYTHTHTHSLSRSNTLPHKRAVQTRPTTARQKKRVEAFFFFGGFVRVRESRRARCALFPNGFVVHLCCGGNLVKR